MAETSRRQRALMDAVGTATVEQLHAETSLSVGDAMSFWAGYRVSDAVLDEVDRFISLRSASR